MPSHFFRFSSPCISCIYLGVINYRPQRSWGKVMFLHLSVILFTEGSQSLSWGVSIPSGGSLSWGLHPGGSLSWRGLCPGGLLSWRPPHTVMSGRYASYWNAFLFGIYLSFPIVVIYSSTYYSVHFI